MRLPARPGMVSLTMDAASKGRQAGMAAGGASFRAYPCIHGPIFSDKGLRRRPSITMIRIHGMTRNR
jgi:hypothetical protein